MEIHVSSLLPFKDKTLPFILKGTSILMLCARRGFNYEFFCIWVIQDSESTGKGRKFVC